MKQNKLITSLYNLSNTVDMQCFLFFPIPVLRVLDIEANRFYDRNHQMYEAALLTRCYTQHALRLFIDAENNHHFAFFTIFCTAMLHLRVK